MVAAESAQDDLKTGRPVLGRYSIVGKLAQGGMAEVYLARQIGPGGYQKLVVIKRVRPHLSKDADFVAMFVNEARLAAMINHPNVVQIFDLGDEPNGAGGKDWFLAMEYLDGRDMLQVGRACRAHNKAVPFDVTARIIADACAGLEHAHGLTGAAGQPLNLVHRDMSPENIVITFEGQVKVVDFGIAKAADNSVRTQAGQIKGKLGYVAPEAILGKPLDARADVFAVGATLYLFLSGRPAFSGNTPMEIFERSLKTPQSPREFNPRVPEGLDAICMKALAQERDKRYRTAGDVRAALEGYLASTGRPLASPQLGQFMRVLFPPDKDPVRQRVDKLLADVQDQRLPQQRAPIPVALEDDDDSPTNVGLPPQMTAPDPVTLQTFDREKRAGGLDGSDEISVDSSGFEEGEDPTESRPFPLSMGQGGGPRGEGTRPGLPLDDISAALADSVSGSQSPLAPPSGVVGQRPFAGRAQTPGNVVSPPIPQVAQPSAGPMVPPLRGLSEDQLFLEPTFQTSRASAVPPPPHEPEARPFVQAPAMVFAPIDDAYVYPRVAQAPGLGARLGMLLLGAVTGLVVVAGAVAGGLYLTGRLDSVLALLLS